MGNCSKIRRRALLGVLSLVLCPGGSGSHAQTATKPIRVGVLLSGSQTQWEPLQRALLDGLREQGYIEGANLVVVRRYGELQGERILSSANELAAMHVDAIVTSCTTTTRMAATAAATTPIVMGSITDPVRAGLVSSFARPGGHITGRGGLGLEMLPKRLEVLRTLLPENVRAGARIAVLMNGKDPAHEAAWEASAPAARALNLELIRLEASGPAGLEAALQRLAGASARGLLVFSDDPVMIEFRGRIAATALALGLPSISSPRMFAEAGGLISYGADMGDDYRLSAVHVVKVANGASPATLPIEQPTQFPMTINLRTAAALGIRIPSELLLRADMTIE